MRVCVLLLLLSAVTFSQTIQEKVSKFEKPKEYGVKYDRFKKRTSIEVGVRLKTEAKNLFSTQYLDMLWLVDIEDTGEITRLVYFDGYVNQPTLRFLADGDLVKLESDTIDRSVLFELQPAVWDKLTSAKVLEIQFQGKEAKFDEKSLKKLQNLNSLIK